MHPRTYLFVPGDRPERFAKAFASGADAVVLDLEDAVAPAAKGPARDAMARWAQQADEALVARAVVRINDAASPAFSDDLRLLHAARMTAVMLPKAESVAQVQAVRAAVPDARVLALIESARGVANLAQVAGADGVVRLVFGTLDYALDLDLDIAESADGLAHAAGAIAVASRVAGLPSPVAGVTPQLDDEARLLADLTWSRRHGFGAKLCIHPRQVAALHCALAPTQQAIDWARRVLAAEAASPGAAQLDGRMIDRPVVLQALRTLQRAGAAPHTTP
jgi:citrate lyase subunit beta / citryl-CoA lyase